MTIEGEWQCTFIPKYAPSLDWGVAAIPTPAGVTKKRAYAPGCVLDVIPTGAPHPDAARTYLEWFYSPRPDGRPSPASDFCELIHNIPTRRDEAQQARFVENDKFKVFIDQLFDREAIPLPPMPASIFYTSRIEAAREWVLYDNYTPEQAAARLQTEVQTELDRIRAYLGKNDS
jgi:ABC-type glycerol-3-phosphate transport system substrate-binding protein